MGTTAKEKEGLSDRLITRIEVDLENIKKGVREIDRLFEMLKKSK